MFRYHTDQRVGQLLFGVSLGAVSILLLIVFFVAKESWPVLSAARWESFGPSQSWHPVEGQFGMWPMVYGTLLTTLGAVLLAAPLGVGSALFCHLYSPGWLARPYRWCIGLLAGIPSVVFGFWGLTVLVPLIVRWQPPGASLLAGIIILTLMIVPTVALTAEAALIAVPHSYTAAAHALGLHHSGMVLKVMLPAARQGIGAGIILSAARALGETMAVLMVTGNVVQAPTSLFEPIRTLTANIALEMAYATQLHRSSLFFSGVVLTIVVGILAWLAQRYGEHLEQRA